MIEWKRNRPLCGAMTRKGTPCRARVVWDKRRRQSAKSMRCRMHGGLSTGPKTPEGKAAVGAAARLLSMSLQRDENGRFLRRGRRWFPLGMNEDDQGADADGLEQTSC